MHHYILKATKILKNWHLHPFHPPICILGQKIEKYPITFVIKSVELISEIRGKLRADALKTYPVRAIVNKYLGCIEEIINIPTLVDYLQTVEKSGLLFQVLDEIVLQSKVEFNYLEEDED